MLQRNRPACAEHARTMKTLTFPPARLAEEIDRIVAERRALRAAGASESALEENRARLIEAQAELSQALTARYLP